MNEDSSALVEISMCPGQTPSDAYEEIQALHEGFVFEDMNHNGSFSAEDSFNEQVVNAWMKQVGSDTIVIWIQYPFDVEINVKSTMVAIAESVQFAE